MSIGSSRSTESAAEAWQEIEVVLDELATLAKSDLPPGDFQGRVLERLAGLLSAAGGMVWHLNGAGRASLACQLRLGEALHGDRQEIQRHESLAEMVGLSGQARQVPPAFRDGRLANASPWLALLCPVAGGAGAAAVIELLVAPEGRASVVEGYLRILQTASELVEEHERRQQARKNHERAAELADVVAFQARAQESLALAESAAAIANEARRITSCDRVSLVTVERGTARVAAISGVEEFERRSEMVKRLEALVGAVQPIGEPLQFPQTEDEVAPAVADRLHALVDDTGARGVLLLPLGREAPPSAERELLGWLCLERFSGVLEPRQRELAETLAKAAALPLANALRYERIPLRGWLEGLVALAGGKQRARLAIAMVLLAGALAVAFVPVEFAVEARGQLLPQRRQHVFAPSDGTVAELISGAGSAVISGQVLLQLESPQLDIAQSELVGKQRTTQEELQAVETERLRGDTQSEAGQNRHQLTARALQLREELRGIEKQLAIVREQVASLAVKSPLAGVVITWDAERQLAGRPVKQGDMLLTVADVAGPWELVLEVDDWRAGHILAAHREQKELPVTYHLGTQPGRGRQGVLQTIAPASELSQRGEPIVRMIARLEDAPAADWRPGATVIARVRCGRRPLGYVWLHEAWEAIRLRLFL